MRKSSHAGSWYSSSGHELGSELSTNLAAVKKVSTTVKALICPHAGLSYSGPTAAWSFGQVDPSSVKRVFVLGPSHHVYLEQPGLTRATVYQTPLGNISLDQDVMRTLSESGLFGSIDISTDEEEHSLEMQLPYIAHIMQQHDYTLVPIMVGEITKSSGVKLGKILAPYLSDPQNLFIISSDFCHWGQRFRYTHYDESAGKIWQSIEALDKLGMEAIKTKSPDAFSDYLAKYRNTICGRNPILLFLHMLVQSGEADKYKIEFVRYAQSSKCVSPRDSSVSYAAGVISRV